MQARRLLSTLLGVAMFSTGCSALTSQGAPQLPPPPPVDDRINAEAAFADDGLTRLIVTPIAGAPLATTSSDSISGSTPGVGSSGGPVDPSRMLTPAMVAAMPAGAALEARDGQVGYVDADGEFVAFDPGALPPEPAPEDESDAAPEIEVVPLYGNPLIDELAADPAVENVLVIGDGTFGVETSDPGVVDPGVFASVEDVPFTVAQEPYEAYQWHLENDGTNLQRVSGEAQTDDADLDIAPTIDRADGGGVVVAVIDSGVDFSHVDLQNSAWSNLGEVCGNGIDDEGNGYIDDCKGWDFVDNDPEPFNRGADVHGTHVAGIITANRNGVGVAGVAPDTRIMDLNVAPPNGAISGASITAAIRYAVDNGADIINMSLASNPGASARGMGGMRDAIDYAASKGVLVVVAAGNSNVDLNSLAVYPASFDRSNMIVVGASTADDVRASFSNHSSTIVDVYAPGQTILSTVPGNGYRFYSGTSQASPNAAGVAALVMQANPDVDLATVIAQVVSTADSVDALSSSVVQGRTNAAAALGLGDAPAIPTEIDVSVAGLSGAGNELDVEVAIATPPDAFAEDYRWELSLVTSGSGGAYAIIEHPVVVDGIETATGATGAVVLGPSTIETAGLTTRLPDGHYSFVIEAVPTADGGSRLGDAFVTTFQVGDGVVSADEARGITTTLVSAPPDSDGATESTPPVPDAGSTQGEPLSSSTTPTRPTETASGGVATPPTSGSSSTDPTTGPIGDGLEAAPTPTAGSDVEAGTPVTTAPISSVPGAGSVPVAPETPTPTVGSPGAGSAVREPEEAVAITSPPSTMPSAPAPVPSGVGDGSASDGEWSISSISPQAGYVDNANAVTIRGSFPASTYVWFGDQAGQVVHQTDTLISVRTPRRSADGVVDLSLRATYAGTVLTVPDAYAFVAWGTPAPGESSGGGGAVNGGSGDGSSERDADGSSDRTSDSRGSDDETDADGSGTGVDKRGESSSSARRTRMTVGTGVDLGNGLTGAAIAPNPAANTPICTAEPCPTSRR